MIDRYAGPPARTPDYDRDHPGSTRRRATHDPRHRAAAHLGPTILRAESLPWRTRARLFLITALWHARHGGIAAVLNPPRWRTWREDLALAAVTVGITAVVVPLVVWAIEATR